MRTVSPAADPPPGAAVTGSDGITRCPWAMGSPMMTAYHDDEWGRPVHGEAALFERVSLEAFQAGLSWSIILARRPAFRDAFAGFDPHIVAALTDADLDALMERPDIIRNRAKIAATRANARATVALRDDGGLDHLIWSHDPGPPIEPVTAADLPTRSDQSAVLAKELKRRGFTFVGPTSAHALCEAIGLVNAHLLACHRRTPHAE